MKTSDLIGPALDWAVAKCEGLKGVIEDGPIVREYRPSTDWSQGGPIIEREGIATLPHGIVGVSETGADINERSGWRAFKPKKSYWMTPDLYFGPTLIVAAMRCYVASKLGNEVEIPGE
jgi:hypothetical protein